MLIETVVRRASPLEYKYGVFRCSLGPHVNVALSERICLGVVTSDRRSLNSAGRQWFAQLAQTSEQLARVHFAVSDGSSVVF